MVKLAALLAIPMVSALLVSANCAAAEVVAFNCSFDMMCTIKDGCSATSFDLKFQIDSISNAAFIIGNNGLSEVSSFKGDEGITFLEPLGSGAVQTTTIAGPGRAVHSRHTIIAASLSPSQYYGVCTHETANG